MTHAEQATAAKEFASSEFGKEFLSVFRQSKEDLLDKAMFATDSMQHKALIVEHAAGVSDCINWIERLVYLADHPELLNDEEEREGDKLEES